MGWYGALLYGIKMSVNSVFAYRPQINFKDSLGAFKVEKLSEKFIDIDQLIKTFSEKQLPKMYISFSEFSHDLKAAEKLIESMVKSKNSIVIFHKNDSPYHSTAPTPTKDYIEHVLNSLSKMQFNYSYIQ